MKKCTFCLNIDNALECESWNELERLCSPVVSNSGCRSESCRQFQKLQIPEPWPPPFILDMNQFFFFSLIWWGIWDLKRSKRHVKIKTMDSTRLIPPAILQIIHHLGTYLVCLFVETKLHLSTPAYMAFQMLRTERNKEKPKLASHRLHVNSPHCSDKLQCFLLFCLVSQRHSESSSPSLALQLHQGLRSPKTQWTSHIQSASSLSTI